MPVSSIRPRPRGAVGLGAADKVGRQAVDRDIARLRRPRALDLRLVIAGREGAAVADPHPVEAVIEKARRECRVERARPACTERCQSPAGVSPDASVRAMHCRTAGVEGAQARAPPRPACSTSRRLELNPGLDRIAAHRRGRRRDSRDGSGAGAGAGAGAGNPGGGGRLGGAGGERGRKSERRAPRASSLTLPRRSRSAANWDRASWCRGGTSTGRGSGPHRSASRRRPGLPHCG